MNDPTADALVAEARRAVHESLILRPAWDTDRVRSLIKDLEAAIEIRAEARAATPAGPAPATGRGTLRERIAEAFARYDWNVAPVFRSVTPNADHYSLADAVLAVLPAPDQQAAVWLDAATRLWHQTNGLTEYGRGARWAIGELRRLAGEAQQDEAPDDTLHACPGRWGGPDCRCFDDDQPARGAQQDPAQASPRRGDQFEQWLTAQRDAHRDTGHGVWTTLDQLLDQYRQHANTEPATDETQQGPAQDSEAEHSGGNAEDCPVCRPEIDKTVLYPWICTGPTAPARSGQPETEARCPEAAWTPTPHPPHTWNQSPTHPQRPCPGVPEPTGQPETD